MPRIPGFDAQEVEILALALRYWRSNRAEGQVRRGDPVIGPDAVDQLLVKLGTAPPRVPQPPRPPGPLSR